MRPLARERRRSGSPEVGGLTIGVLAVLLLAGCGETARPKPAPVVLVGIDGLEPALVDELVAAGRMPALERFQREGVLGTLASMYPTYSPVIWTSLATGQEPEAHGIPFFHDDQKRIYTSNCRKVPALWNIVSDAELRVDVVGWWVSYPAEAVNGRLIATYAAQVQAQIVWKQNLWKEVPEQTWPPDLIGEIEPMIAWFDDVDALRERFWQSFTKPARPIEAEGPARAVEDLMWSFSGDLSCARIAEHFLSHPAKEGPTDLTMVYLGLPDVAGHRVWRYHAPGDFEYEVPAEHVEDYGQLLREAYEAVDAMLAGIVARAPANATILVVSDHGMHANRDPQHGPEDFDSGHHQDAPPGVFAALGPQVIPQGRVSGNQPGGTLGDVLGVAPLILHLLGEPVPEHWLRAGHDNPLEQVLDPQWRRDNPLRLSANRDAEFRPATAPRSPIQGMNERFIDALDALGYTEVGNGHVENGGENEDDDGR